MLGSLLLALEHLVDPVVLEGVLIGVKPFRLRDNLHLLVVVRGASVRANHGLFKVGVLEVGAGILNHRLIVLPLLAIVLARLRR